MRLRFVRNMARNRQYNPQVSSLVALRDVPRIPYDTTMPRFVAAATSSVRLDRPVIAIILRLGRRASRVSEIGVRSRRVQMISNGLSTLATSSGSASGRSNTVISQVSWGELRPVRHRLRQAQIVVEDRDFHFRGR